MSPLHQFAPLKALLPYAGVLAALLGIGVSMDRTNHTATRAEAKADTALGVARGTDTVLIDLRGDVRAGLVVMCKQTHDAILCDRLRHP